jgi:hypothetical protein
MTNPRSTSPLVALLISAAVVVACGSSTPVVADSTPTPTPVAGEPTPVVTDAPADPTATVDPATPTDPPVDPVDAIPTFDIAALTGAIPGVDSYRTSVSMDGVVQYESVVVTQPVLSKAIATYDGDTVTSRFVVIGEEVWTADGADGAFELLPAEFAATMLLAFDPTMMLSAFAGADFANSGAANLGTEDKNGVQAVHVRLDSTSFFGAGGAIPAGAAIDIWVAEAGYLVAWEMTGFGSGSDMSIQVTGINDSANVVERPR